MITPDTCKHYFQDSKWCLLCGWIPPHPDGVTRYYHRDIGVVVAEADLARLTQERDALKQERDASKRQFSQAEFELSEVVNVLEGRGASDFGESFPLVLSVSDLKARYESLIAQIRATSEGLQRMAAVFGEDGSSDAVVDAFKGYAADLLALVEPPT